MTPVSLVIFVSLSIGFLSQLLLEASLFRIVLTSFVVEMVLLPLSWCIVLNPEERHVISAKIANLVSRVGCGKNI